jgi:hypothetical protein
MDADETSAVPDEPLEGSLLVSVEDGAGREQEDDDFELAQRAVREHAGVLGGRDVKTVICSEAL